MKQYGRSIFLLIHVLYSNMCASEEITKYAQNFIKTYVPFCHYSDPVIENLVKKIAYAAIEKPKLMQDFKNTVLSSFKQYTGQLLNSGFNIKIKDILYTISVASPVEGPQTIEDYEVFILESCLLTEEEYVQNMKKILDKFKDCKDIEKEIEISKI